MAKKKHHVGEGSLKSDCSSLLLQRVPLVSSSDEYKEVKDLFCKTMRGFDITKIERIQNKALWEVFQL